MNQIEADARGLLNGWLIRAAATASLTAALCLHLASTSPGLITQITEWLLNRPPVFSLFYLVLASAGLTLASAGPRWKGVERRSRRLSDLAAYAYASTSGALIGWTLCCCLGAAFTSPGLIWLALLASSMVLSIAIAPLFCLLVARITAASISERLFPAAWRLTSVRALGYFLVLLAACGAWNDLVVFVPASY